MQAIKTVHHRWLFMLLTVSLIGFYPAAGYTQTVLPNARDNFHIYVLIGQSNMVGRGDIQSQDKAPLARTVLFDREHQWVAATAPLNRFSSTSPPTMTAELNPGYTFAQAIAAANPQITIGLISNARGGTSIDQWQKDYRGPVSGFDLQGREWTGTQQDSMYTLTMARIKAAQQDGVIKGILWHQGESNRSDAAYLLKLEKLIADLREDIGDPHLPFIAGEVYNGPGAYSTSPGFNVRLAGLPAKIPFTAVASSAGTTVWDVTTHFDSAGQRLLGSRYANHILHLVYRAVIDTTPPSVPQGLQVVSKTASTVTLEWQAASDDRAVMGYQVYVNGNLTPAHDTAAPRCLVTNLVPGSRVRVHVTAYDQAGNSSSLSESLYVDLDKPAIDLPAYAAPLAPSDREMPELELNMITAQDFESALLGALPAGWEWLISTKSPDKPMVVQTTPLLIGTGGQQVLMFSRTAGTANVTSQAVFNFAPVQEWLRVLFYVYTLQPQRDLRVVLGGSQNSPTDIHNLKVQTGIYLAFGETLRPLRDAGKNQWYTGIEYASDGWHKVTLDINIAAQAYDVFIDNSLVPSNKTPIPFTGTYTDLNTIAFTYQTTSNTNNSQPVYIDDVIIWGR